jgi:hypothetical protein
MLASSSTSCSQCNEIGILTCDGCNKIYCQQHLHEHQRYLDEELDWITVEHDDLMEDLAQQIATPKYHPSMGIINKWEEESIARIRQSAFLARRTLIDALDKNVFEVKKSLNTLTHKLREARHRVKSFNEKDIQRWATTLQELKQMPVFPVTIDKNSGIYGLMVDVRQQPRTPQPDSNRDIPTLWGLISIAQDLISPIPTPITTECQQVPRNTTKKTHAHKKKVKFSDVPSNKSETITPGGVIIIREQQNDEAATLCNKQNGV